MYYFLPGFCHYRGQSNEFRTLVSCFLTRNFIFVKEHWNIEIAWIFEPVILFEKYRQWKCEQRSNYLVIKIIRTRCILWSCCSRILDSQSGSVRCNRRIWFCTSPHRLPYTPCWCKRIFYLRTSTNILAFNANQLQRHVRVPWISSSCLFHVASFCTWLITDIEALIGRAIVRVSDMSRTRTIACIK